MSKNFTCPYCQNAFALHERTYTNLYVAAGGHFTTPSCTSAVQIEYFICPKCDKISVKATGVGSQTMFSCMPLLPNSIAKQFPDYIPVSIRNDYEEACAIVNLSPKASATLSRRCLQGMIRDFWQITGKKRLVDEIDSLKEKVPATQWRVVDSLRHIGNIGAHPEADTSLIIEINPEDAKKLIAVIELLIKQWYVERHEQEQLYSDILALDENTKTQKAKE